MNKVKIVIGILVFVVLAMITVSDSMAQSPAKSYIVHYKITTSGFSQKQTFYFKEGKYAMVTEMGTTIFDGENMYSINSATNMAFKMDFGANQQLQNVTPSTDNLGTLVGTGYVLGKLCEIYEQGNYPEKVKLWIWKDTGILLKSLGEGPNGSKKEATSVLFPTDLYIWKFCA